MPSYNIHNDLVNVTGSFGYYFYFGSAAASVAMDTTMRSSLLDHSITVSAMGDFSPTLSEHPRPRSNSRSTTSDNSPVASSIRSYSPPAWRKAGSGWFNSLSPDLNATSKDASPEYHSADEDGEYDVEEEVANATAARIPLPESPIHGRSPSPTPEPVLGAERAIYDTPATARQNPFRSPPPMLSPLDEDLTTPTQMNYIRFSTSLDVIQRTEPIEAAIEWVRHIVGSVTKSRWTMLYYATTGILISWLYFALTAAPGSGEMPDLVKVANMAQSFQPAIYYSEHGVAQIEELQDTGLAVWDLGESLRTSNMTGAPAMARQLDGLSESIKTLALELTRFFVSVDSDVDSILYVMEWAQRELESISDKPSMLSAIWSNAHTALTKAGVLRENQLTVDLLGQTVAQRSRATLERTFQEFLGVLEESINSELTSSTRLFALLEAIDGQFLNLRRSTVREEDQQERLESDFLSSLWTKAIGANASRLRKFAKNRDLLASVKDRTMRNKNTLTDHKQRLLTLKANLDILRRRLVSPLLRDCNSTQSIEQQIRGMNDVYLSLKGMREEQKRKVLELSFGPGSRRDPGAREIEAS